MYKDVNEPPKHVLGVRFGVYFTLLGAVVRVSAIAHFPLGSPLKIKMKGANGNEERGREEKRKEQEIEFGIEDSRLRLRWRNRGRGMRNLCVVM